MLRTLRAAQAYREKLGRWPNLLRPRTFNEKMQIAKLTWRSPLMPMLADKVLAKAFIAEHFGADLVTPNLFAGSQLPPRPERNWPTPYVIKTNHGWASNVFVRDTPDWDRIEADVDRWLSRIHGRRFGEWLYGRIVPQVLVEPMIAGSEDLVDYKFFAFGGRTELIRVHTGRHTDHRVTFYDRNWERQPFGMIYPQEPRSVPRPLSLDRMTEVAEEIGRRFPFVRVDFYEIDGRPRFGEVTFYSDSGYGLFDPPAADLLLGDFWPAGKPASVW